MDDVIKQWGKRLCSKDRAFRQQIQKILNSYKAGIRGAIAKRFMTLSSASQISDAFAACKDELRLADDVADPFAAFANLDDN